MEELVEQETAEEVEIEEATTSTEEEIEAQDESTAEDTAAEEPQEPKPQSGVQKRINELTRARYEEKRAREDAEKRYHELLMQQSQVKTTTSESPPKEDDFDTYEDYLDERARFVARQEFKTVQQSLENERKNQEKQQAEQSFAQKVDGLKMAGSSKHADFLDVTQSMPLTKDTLNATLESDIGDDILYYLGNNIEEAQQIAQMSIHGQAMAVGRLESKLKQPPKKTTNAPAPITPVSTTGSNMQVDLSNPKTDDNTWAKEFRKRRQQRRGF